MSVMSAPNVEALAASVVARDRASIARALNLIEDRRPSMRAAQRALLRALENPGGAGDRPQRARAIGVTGPPGAGKSTLCSAIAAVLLARDQNVSVVAVDPSSAASGGALLGDRVRIIAPGNPDPRLFVRSLAAGGELGGLARSAHLCVEILARASDTVLIETVGVGQSEIEVSRVADVTVVVVQPASGDALQFLKAGVFEIPDIIVINKADLGDVARRAEAELRHALVIGAQASVHGVTAMAPKVLSVSAANGSRVIELVDAIESTLQFLEQNGALAVRRVEAAIARVVLSIERRVGEMGVEALGGIDAVRARVRRDIVRGAAAIDVVDQSTDDAIAALRKT